MLVYAWAALDVPASTWSLTHQSKAGGVKGYTALFLEYVGDQASVA